MLSKNIGFCLIARQKLPDHLKLECRTVVKSLSHNEPRIMEKYRQRLLNSDQTLNPIRSTNNGVQFLGRT